MITFIMLTRLAAEGLDSPQTLEDREKAAMERIRSECPEVEWVQDYALLGPYQYLDIFKAPDIASATKVGTLIRTYGHAHSEIWPATEWREFKEMLHSLPGRHAA